MTEPTDPFGIQVIPDKNVPPGQAFLINPDYLVVSVPTPPNRWRRLLRRLRHPFKSFYMEDLPWWVRMQKMSRAEVEERYGK